MNVKREDVIQSISKIRDSKGSPKLKDLEALRIVMTLTPECRECTRNAYHYGQCTGRTSKTPCLIFEQRRASTPAM
ncbi:hypothetical protein Desaci_1378 [Desulfosporosinus acidiphilus SJ4]|uniref:Uncharacterized protein n=1 Tax=Desulfosporosinus acidiphilus (strain DSM 22704 / JCM 16185 / SJ4) TaxID=646529 RepID=I4D3M7_DESAJ|nr:hypothetical protein [Desulfosporosinus acidiphilus]AFM40401.1 hypothetical protein Desaci_1378 [Desulfosporosinus acidiphilus SJ4]